MCTASLAIPKLFWHDLYLEGLDASLYCCLERIIHIQSDIVMGPNRKAAGLQNYMKTRRTGYTMQTGPASHTRIMAPSICLSISDP